MGDVTKFSGIFASMATEYSRSAKRGRGRKASEPKPSTVAGTSPEAAIRAAMEQALARRLQVKADA